MNFGNSDNAYINQLLKLFKKKSLKILNYC